MTIEEANIIVTVEQAAGCPMDALPADSEWLKLFNELIQEQMENVPEKIYLDLGFDCPNDCDFNELSQVTWSQDNATGNGIEFTRSDIAEQMAKEFAEFVRNYTTPFGRNMYRANKKYLTEADKIYSLDELFTEFINSRSAQKAE
jgi:radical SAM superfamily enzyme